EQTDQQNDLLHRIPILVVKSQCTALGRCSGAKYSHSRRPRERSAARSGATGTLSYDCVNSVERGILRASARSNSSRAKKEWACATFRATDLRVSPMDRIDAPPRLIHLEAPQIMSNIVPDRPSESTLEITRFERHHPWAIDIQ